MKPNVRHGGLALVLALLAPSVLAMNLQQLYDKALAQDATIRASRAALASGQERLPQARAQLLPAVQASLSRNRNSLDTTSPNLLGQDTTTSSDYLSFGKSVTLRQPLFSLQRYYQYQQARDLVLDAEATHQRNLQDLVVRVGGAYMEALLTADQLRLVQAQKQQYTAVLDAARKALAAGSGTRTDIDDAQARLDMAIADELQAQQNVDYTRRQLEILVNEPVGRLSALDPKRAQALPRPLGSLDDWLRLALEQSPDLRSLQARLDAAEKEIAKARAGHAPTLEGVLQWSDSGNENVTRLNSRFVNSAIGVQLQVPIYQGGAVSSQVRQSVAEKTRAEEALEAGRREMSLRVHKEYRGVSEGELRIRALEQALRSAEQLLVSTQRSRQAGVRTTLDVLNAEQQLATVSRDLMQARYLTLVSRLRLYALSGMAPEQAIAEIAAAFEP